MKKTIPVLLGLSLGLVGCGGGGGGGDSAAAGGVTVNYDGPSPTTVAVIDTQEKADTAVTAAVAAAMNMETGSTGVYKVGGTGDATTSLMQFTMQEAADRIRASGGTTVLAGATQTEQCSEYGGTVTVESREADPNAVSVGDYVRLRYDHCMLDYATEIHGVVYTEVKNATGLSATSTGDYWALTLYMDMGVSMKSDGMYVAMDGAYTGAMAYDSYSATTTMDMYGDRYAFEFDDGVNHFVQLMTDFDMSISENDYTGDTTAQYTFTVTNNLIGGSVTVDTVEPFVIGMYDDYPHAGKVVVTGEGGSKVMLTVNSNVDVTLSYDLDGDNEYGTTDADDPADKTVLWSEL